MVVIVVLLALLSQENSDPEIGEIQRHSCELCFGKRIHHTMGTILFCVPRGMKVHRDAGFEGDVQDIITFAKRRQRSQLIVSSSTNPSGYRKFAPDWFPADAPGHTSARNWRCSEGNGRDLRLDRNGRYWRMITLPLGYAEYSDVPANIAVQFDKVIDSLCCRPLRR
jgi:hypothetical protein